MEGHWQIYIDFLNIFFSLDKVSYGDMVACDNEDCPYEWFHYPCVGITAPPKVPSINQSYHSDTRKRRVEKIVFVILFFVDSLKEKAEVPLSSSGMVLKVVLGTPETRYYLIRWLKDTRSPGQV